MRSYGTKCPECKRSGFATPAGLGSHRLKKHGIEGQARTALLRRKKLNKKFANRDNRSVGEIVESPVWELINDPASLIKKMGQAIETEELKIKAIERSLLDTRGKVERLKRLKQMLQSPNRANLEAA